MCLTTSSLAAAPAAQASDVILKRWIPSRHAIGHYRSARNPTACRRMTRQNERKRCHPRLVNVLRHEAPAGSQPCKSPFHRDEHPWSVVAVLLPRPIRVWKQVTDQHIELIGPVARANLVGVHYHHVPCVPLQPIDGGTETTGTMRLLAHRVVLLPLDTTEPVTVAI